METAEIELVSHDEKQEEKMHTNLAEDILSSSFLHHSEWNDEIKATAAAIEVAGLTGLDPKDIRPIIKDGKTGELILVDSGSCKCLEPASPGLRANGTPGTSYKLATASGKPLVCYSEKQRTIELGGGLKVTHTFLIAKVGKTIIGSDLIRRFGFSIDCYRNRFMGVSPGRHR